MTFDIDSDFLKGYEENQPLRDVNVDTTLLPTLLSGDANVCVILTRRAVSGGEEKSFHKYFCNGETSITPFETWSSSKIFAMANAASSLRTEATCALNEYGDVCSSDLHLLILFAVLHTGISIVTEQFPLLCVNACREKWQDSSG